jgi:hypothetical protein
VAATAAVAALVVGVWLHVAVVAPHPFWAFLAGDGEVVFFYNALAFAVGALPGSGFHPGTPVQATGAMLIRLLHVGVDGAPRFLPVVYALGLAAALAALAGVARGLLRGVAFVPAVAVLLTYWAHPASWLYLTQWGSYLFHLPLGVAVLWTLWDALGGLAANDARPVARAGLVGGLACSVQLVFAPFVLAGVLALLVATWTAPAAPRPAPPRSRFVLVLSVLWLVVAALFVRRVVRMGDEVGAPLWAFAAANVVLAVVGVAVAGGAGLWRERRFTTAARAAFTYLAAFLFAWLTCTFAVIQIVWRRYEAGRLYDNRLAEVAGESIAANVAALVARAPYWLELAAVVTIAAGWAVARVARADREAPERPRHLAFGAALVVAAVAGVALPLNYGDFSAATAGLALRYTLPVAVVLLLAAAWLARLAADGWLPSRPGVTALAAVLLVAVVGGEIGRGVAWQRRVVAASLHERDMIDHTLATVERELGHAPRTVLYEVAHPVWAARWGSLNADRLFDADLDRVYPRLRELNDRGEGEALAAWPREPGRAELMIIREAAFEPDKMRHLVALGAVRRTAEGVNGPVLVVRVRPLTTPGAGPPR